MFQKASKDKNIIIFISYGYIYHMLHTREKYKENDLINLELNLIWL